MQVSVMQRIQFNKILHLRTLSKKKREPERKSGSLFLCGRTRGSHLMKTPYGDVYPQGLQDIAGSGQDLLCS